MNCHPSMKKSFTQKLGRLILPTILSLGFFSASVSHGQTNAYWDVNGITNGQGGSGSWVASTNGTNWTTNSVNADANNGGPIGGGLFAVANGAAGAVLTNSGNFIFNIGGTAGTITQGGSYQAYAVNFLTTGYTWYIDGTGTNNRTITTTNGVNLGANSLTLLNGPRGLNAFTFAGPTTATAVGLTGSAGASLTLRNLVADSTTNSFGFYLSGGAIPATIPINVDIGVGSRIFLGSQSSGGATYNGNIALNTNASGVALNLTNSSSGTVAFNGVISGASGLILDNASSGKIAINGANTFSGDTIINNSGTGNGLITISNAAAFGSGTIVSAGASTIYIRAEASGYDITNNCRIEAGSTLRLNANNSGWNITASGTISGAGSMVFSNSGVNYYLTGTNNSYGGGVSVGNGTLYFTKLGSAGQNSSLGTNATITVGGPSATTTGALRWIGTSSEVSDKAFVLAGTTGGFEFRADGATNSTVTLNGNITSTGLGAKKLLFAGYNTNTLIINGLINENGGANSVTIGVSSSGTVVLGNTNNSFSGSVTVTNSTGSQNTWLQTANIGMTGLNSPLGQNGTINIGGSSSSAFTGIRYTGLGEVSDKVINLAGVGGATLDQSGTGILKFTSAMTATGAGAKTITLSGSTAGTGEITSGITDLGGNVISVTKSGTGTWVLSGNNTYTGPTVVGLASASANGILRIAGLSSLSPNTSLSGSTSSTNISTIDLATAGSYVVNSYGTTNNLGNNLSFTASSGGSTTLTFTNATNVMTSGTSQGRYLYNNSSNLLLELQGALDISSSSSNDMTIGGFGDINIRGNILNSSTGVRSITKVGSGALRLFGTNTYNGTNKVSGGILVMGSSKSLPANTPTVLDGGTLTVSYASGDSDIIGNLSITANSLIDLGTGTSGSTLKFASGTNWSNKILTVANSSTGAKLYITNTANVATNQIKSAENPTATASLASDGLLSFSNSVAAPSGLSYTPSTLSATVGTVISNLTPTVTGTGITYSVSPSLPAGLSISSSTGVISGTPTVVASSASYTIMATNSGGNTTATVTIEVKAAGPTFDDAYKNKNISDLAPNGLSYLMNYAFGGSDTTDPKLPVQDTTDPTKLALVAYVRTGDTSLSVSGEAAATLDFSSPSNAPYVVITNSDAPAGMEKRSYSVSVGGDRKFLRLKATKQ